MHKFLWLDTETTGLDPVVNDPIQISGIVVIGAGKTAKVQEFDFRVQPRNRDAISQEALAVNGITLEDLYTFDPPKEVHIHIKSLFKRYVDPYNRNDKFMLCGQNVKFDDGFMREFFKKNGDDYWYSWVHYAPVDVATMAILLEFKHKKKMFHDYKLETMCKVMGVEIGKAHDSLYDIRATRALAGKLWAAITKCDKCVTP